MKLYYTMAVLHHEGDQLAQAMVDVYIPGDTFHASGRALYTAYEGKGSEHKKDCGELVRVEIDRLWAYV